MESIYREIIKKSWQIIKNYRWLWFFGLFTAFLGNGGEIDILLQYKKLTNAPDYLSSLVKIFSFMNLNDLTNRIINSFVNNTFWSITSIIFTLIIFILIIWLVIVSQGAIIEAAYKLGNNKKITFKQSIKKGQKTFWPILGLNVFANFIIYFTLIILSLPFAVLYLSNNSQLAIITITVLAFIILVPISIIISFILKYSLFFVVIKKENAINAFIKAWKLFINNWLISIEMAIILFAVNFIVGLGIILLLIIISIPFFGLIFIAMMFGSQVIIFASVSLGVILLTIILLLTGALLGSFQFTAWTLLWQKIQSGKKYPKLVRLTTKQIK